MWLTASAGKQYDWRQARENSRLVFVTHVIGIMDIFSLIFATKARIWVKMEYVFNKYFTMLVKHCLTWKEKVFSGSSSFPLLIICRPVCGVRLCLVDHLQAGPQVWINPVPSYQDQSRRTRKTPWIRRNGRKRCKKLIQAFWVLAWTQRIEWTWERYKLSRIN